MAISSKIRSVLSGVLLLMLTTSCIKSDEPIRFDGRLIESVSSTSLGSAYGHIDSEAKKLKRVVQLRTEGSRTYLYHCTPGAEIERIRAVLYAIPNQENTFVMSLEEGNFLFGGSRTSGHEIFVLQPYTNFMAWWLIDPDVSNVAKDFLANFQPTPSDSDTYRDSVLKEFLYEYADEFIEERGIRGFQYLQGDLTSCDFMS